MGLDMYLYKENYVRNWNHMTPEQRHKITVKKNNKVRKDIKPERISYVVELVGYWRKFNALHSWFIENLADGVDNCQRIPVEIDDLKKLLGTLKEVKSVLDKSKVVVKVLVCQRCAAQNPIQNKFCGNCGHSLYPAPQVTCTNCGLKTPVTMKFCGYCGSKRARAPPTQT